MQAFQCQKYCLIRVFFIQVYSWGFLNLYWITDCEQRTTNKANSTYRSFRATSPNTKQAEQLVLNKPKKSKRTHTLRFVPSWLKPSGSKSTMIFSYRFFHVINSTALNVDVLKFLLIRLTTCGQSGSGIKLILERHFIIFTSSYQNPFRLY